MGYDPLTGRTLEPWERTVAAVAVAVIPAARLVARAFVWARRAYAAARETRAFAAFAEEGRVAGDLFAGLRDARSVAGLRTAVGDIGDVVRSSRLWSAAGELRLGRGIADGRTVAGDTVRNRAGRAVPRESGLEWALRSPLSRAQLVVEKYDINLRAAGRRVTMEFDPNLPLTPTGKVFGGSPTVIVLGPGALVSEEEMARTIAHELRHARAYLGSGSNQEFAAQAAENALAEYIGGLR